MHDSRPISLDRGWIIILRNLGLKPADVLARAGLPLSILAAESTRLSVDDYFALLQSVEHLANDPLLPLKVGSTTPTEAFSAPFFAALCSPTLAVAVERIATHKRLTAPMTLTSDQLPAGLKVSWMWDDPTIRPPAFLMAMELTFLTHLARTATGEPIHPVHVTCPAALEPTEAYGEFFGVPPVVGPEVSMTFSSADANRPFLTARASLWAFFEPDLRSRLDDVDAASSMSDQARSALFECLPSGDGSVAAVAQRLGVSKRTLQRRLHRENVTFREIVRETRERLARHYLADSALSYREISFLLGFGNPSSFFRGFRDWTGDTPESFRTAHRGTAVETTSTDTG